jgi:predicted nucleotidyltransferase
MDTVLDKLIFQIKEIADPVQIILFGSRAKHSERDGRDYDLLIAENVYHWALKIAKAHL